MSMQSSFRSHRKHKLKAEINVVPYIDVMLVLLVIFMITAPMIHHSVQVDLPADKQPSSKKGADKSSEIFIEVINKADAATRGYDYKVGNAKENRTFLNSDAGSLEMIAYIATLRVGKTDEQAPVILYGDKAAEYGDVVSLFAKLKGEKVSTLKLATQPAKSGSGAK
jgi:biopolymer transport protein TolR